MVPVSIVIITKNEADIIGRCIEKARQITDDIVVIDSGSTDETANIAANNGCRVFEKVWDGYGANKNKGIALAKYDWILSIDADEIPDDKLIRSLGQIKLTDPAIVYDIKFRSWFGAKLIRYGSWGRDHHIRLFNRQVVKWSETVVHETLLFPQHIRVKKLAGGLHHFSVKNIEEYDRKGIYYAKLSAKKYFIDGKRAGLIKFYLSPLFGFFKNYVVHMGFLDGREGWEIARTTLKNTRRKYQFLSQMENLPTTKEAVKESLAVEY